MQVRTLGAALLALGLAALSLVACATKPPPQPAPRAAPRPPPRRPPPAPSEPRISRPPREAEPEPSAERFLPLSALKGWEAEDHAAALAAFRETCGVARDPAMAQVCRSARAIGPLDRETSERFFEANFRAERIAGEGVLTAYFSPEYPARHRPNEDFNAPLRARPADLRMVDAGTFDPSQSGRQTAARDTGSGPLTPYPDRAAIEATPPDKALAWMRPEDLFFLQIQGSGVLTFDDGGRRKAVYAANNGWPFLGIANPMRDRGLLARDNTSAEAIRAWLADHRGPEAKAIMQLNPRYAFFSLAPDDGRQPVGTANAPLPAGRSLAVDPAFHPMGDYLWIDASAPLLNGAFPAYRRLAMALDTGGAIKGEVRADLYLGVGPAAGLEAGRVRHTLRLYRLIPKDSPPVKRPLKPEERHIWGMVAATVHPLPGRATPRAEPSDAIPAPALAQAAARIAPPPLPAGAKRPKPRPALDPIEPRRKHRIAKAREEIGARLDLHGLDQDRARGVLERFLARAWDEGFRAVLVITGKGVKGDGILKRRAPEWLAAPHLAHMVAGISDAARHHGGEGALYVALKRKSRG